MKVACDIDGKVEPEADQANATMSECMLVSIAISLKRIADATCGTQDGKNSGILHAIFDISNRQ